jgi:tetratricopeptide (TPR) repeat protein
MVKAFSFLAFVALISFAFIKLTSVQKTEHSYNIRQKIDAYKKKYAFGCAPDLASIDFNDPANSVPLLDGWGKYNMPVTTSNDSSNIYFQQGINMYYSFHIIEALASFEKSITFDEDFAMGYWGKALAYGPNINDVGYTTASLAFAAIQKAREKCSNCTPVEKALIAAMEVRYSNDSTQTREHLNQLYADAMKKVHGDFLNSGDAAALYADALMVQHPWDLYDRYYNPKPWTPEIVRVLESLVKQFPDNPGANHYYIHAVEGSAHPEKGLEVANRLGAMMPNVAHLVHMPSHIYIRAGYYDKGVQSNINAVKGYHDYRSRFAPVDGNTFLYLIHNLHMQAACAQMDARYTEALKLSIESRNSFDSGWMDDRGYWAMYSQYVYMTPFFTQVRFGKWDDILNASAIPASRTYANAMWHFARGMAQARKHNLTEATAELGQMKDSAQSTQLQESPAAFNPGITVVNLAEKILQGIMAEENGDYIKAVSILKEAVDMEDVMLYNEPRDWLLPVRQYLGNTLMKAKQYDEAEKIYKEDLRINPNNAWALTGLQNALTLHGKTTEVAKIKTDLAKALVRCDIKFKASVF